MKKLMTMLLIELIIFSSVAFARSSDEDIQEAMIGAYLAGCATFVKKWEYGNVKVLESCERLTNQYAETLDVDKVPNEKKGEALRYAKNVFNKGCKEGSMSTGRSLARSMMLCAPETKDYYAELLAK